MYKFRKLFKHLIKTYKSAKLGVIIFILQIEK